MIVTRKTINQMMGFAKYYYGKNLCSITFAKFT